MCVMVINEVRNSRQCSGLTANLVWHKLSAECVHASSVNMFKNRIDKYLVKAGST